MNSFPNAFFFESIESLIFVNFYPLSITSINTIFNSAFSTLTPSNWVPEEGVVVLSSKIRSLSTKLFLKSQIRKVLIDSFSELVDINTAFINCHLLTEIQGWPESLIDVPEEAFAACATLSMISPYNAPPIPDTFFVASTIHSIGPSAFQDTHFLQIIFEKNSALTSIGKSAFSGVNTLKRVLYYPLQHVLESTFWFCPINTFTYGDVYAEYGFYHGNITIIEDFAFYVSNFSCSGSSLSSLSIGTDNGKVTRDFDVRCDGPVYTRVPQTYYSSRTVPFSKLEEAPLSNTFTRGYPSFSPYRLNRLYYTIAGIIFVFYVDLL